MDAVITDIAMLGTDGRELLAGLRRDPRLAPLPVIALTGLARPGDGQWLLDAGFTAQLDKPVTLDRLLAALESVLPGEA